MRPPRRYTVGPPLCSDHPIQLSLTATSALGHNADLRDLQNAFDLVAAAGGRSEVAAGSAGDGSGLVIAVVLVQMWPVPGWGRQRTEETAEQHAFKGSRHTQFGGQLAAKSLLGRAVVVHLRHTVQVIV